MLTGPCRLHAWPLRPPVVSLPAQQNFQRLPQPCVTQETKVVMGSSAERVCIWKEVHVRCWHLPHWNASVDACAQACERAE